MSGESAREAWLAASDGLVAGVHHALNNRMASLSALAQLLAMGAAPPGAERTLMQEVERFSGTLRLLGLVPRHPSEGPIPLQLPHLFPDVLALVGQHREVRDVEFAVDGDPGVLPVLCADWALTHALLALLVALGEAARERGAPRVSVRWAGDERFVVLEAEVEGGTGGEPPGLAGVAALFGEVGAEAQPTGAGIVVRFPTLPEARRREREG